MNHYIISYDITNTPLRTKLSKTLERYGCERMQKSVFLAPNFESEDLMLLQKEVEQLMQSHQGRLTTDSVVCFPVKKAAIAEMVWSGNTQALRRILEELLFLLI